ncbi:hypothetical protein DFH08DRAFT_47292 [Mycena albidolilacea]|uniref:Uncharacterized protein n=1 Tax=Mycena albidolilacea TaxID=1033008 RepID=A0AAD7EX17_9AGAR|nr:hypothetical protein DFH08DRAFT_47292 [Mycena albidolilacea]
MCPHKCLAGSPADADALRHLCARAPFVVWVGLIYSIYFSFYFYSSPPLSPTCTRTDDVLHRSQCQRRALVCEYPAESRRGMRKKKAMPEGPPSASGSSSAASDIPVPVPAATTAAAAADAPSVPGPDFTDADTSTSTSVDGSTGAAGRTRDPRPRLAVAPRAPVVKTESEGECVPSDTGAGAGIDLAW